MAAVRDRDTEPERMLRRAVFSRGLRYRLHDRRLPGRPDLVFPRARVAVFVDGDFWHGAGWKERGFSSMEAQFQRRSEFWVKKIRENVARDERVNARLRELDWTVVRLWESQIRKSLDECVEYVCGAVVARRRRA